MSTQVDWWQIKNVPPITGTQIDEYPVSIGPIPVTTVKVNTDGGLVIDNFFAFNTLLASLTQQGVIGTLGGQQIAGNLTVAAPGTSGPAPIWSLPNYLFTIQNGYLAFYSDGEGPLTTPNASIEYDLAGATPFLHLFSGGDIEIVGGLGGTGNQIDIATNGGNSFLELTPVGSFLGDTLALQLQSGPALINFGVPYVPGGSCLDYDGGSPGVDAYSLNQGSAVGIYDLVFGGLTFSGGLLTDDSGDYTFPPGSFKLSPFVSGELTYTDSGGNVINTPNISTDGAGNLTFANVTTEINFPDFAFIEFKNATGTVPVKIGSSSGGSQNAVYADIHTDGSNAMYGLSLSGSGLSLADSFGIRWAPVAAWYVTPDTAIDRNSPGNVALSDAAGTTGAIIGTSGAQLCMAGGSTFGIFGTTPAGQYAPTAPGSGFTQNTSANTVYLESTFDGGVGGSAYTINDIVAALKSWGWFAV